MTATIQQKEYKLKLDNFDFKNGDKVEAEIDGVEGSKVLLLKANSQLRALGPKCTHYGTAITRVGKTA